MLEREAEAYLLLMQTPRRPDRNASVGARRQLGRSHCSNEPHADYFQAALRRLP